MSFQCGMLTPGRPVARRCLEQLSSLGAFYGPDGHHQVIQDQFGAAYRPFYATKLEGQIVQPIVSSKGLVLMWDGRLDNRIELAHFLSSGSAGILTDAAIVLLAYDAWGQQCLKKLLGDWALTIWDPIKQSLTLAKDFVGTRPLFYMTWNGGIVWSSCLESLVQWQGRPFNLEERYIAGYFLRFPDIELTPYQGIHAVPAGSVLVFQDRKTWIRPYWEFDTSCTIRYSKDSEYEEHFRDVLFRAVRRRLRSDSPVVAELSGGMDSSTIVSVADQILQNEGAETPRLDTLSHFDDSEPNWNEKHYFTLIEARRGCKGAHIDIAVEESFASPLDDRYFSPNPGPDQGGIRIEEGRVAAIKANGNRVLFSGIGGDEFLGGVPAPIPELADLLLSMRLSTFWRRLEAWSLARKQPWTHLLWETISNFLPDAISELVLPTALVPPWISPEFARRNTAEFRKLRKRLRVSGPLPSQQFFSRALDVIRQQLGVSLPSCVGCYHTTYPLLDRDLLEFLYAIPREQIIRPGERRSLMKRSMRDIVPKEILGRGRKAFIARRPLAEIETQWEPLSKLATDSRCRSLGLISEEVLLASLHAARHGRQEHLVSLVRTVRLEHWLKSVCLRNLLSSAIPQEKRPKPSLVASTTTSKA